MDSDMTSAHWYLLLGSLLVALVLSRGLLARLLLSSATIYLIVGFIVSLIVPHGNSLNPMHHAELLGRIAEVALLISLFTVGLRMGVPILDRRWFVPLRLAVFSMAVTVGLITAIGVWGLRLAQPFCLAAFLLRPIPSWHPAYRRSVVGTLIASGSTLPARAL
jgi:NhaP-type Na+/H+ or K+/H+ antiporter